MKLTLRAFVVGGLLTIAGAGLCQVGGSGIVGGFGAVQAASNLPLTGGTLTGSLSAPSYGTNGNLSMAGWPALNSSFIYEAGSVVSGDTSAGPAQQSPNYLQFNDVVNAGPNVLNGFFVRQSFGGGAMQGNRNGIFSYISLTGTPNAADASQQDYVSVGGQGYADAVAKSGLTGGGTFSGYAGNLWGFSGNVWATGNAANWSSIYGAELDTAVLSGGSVAEKYGLLIVHGTTDAVAGTIDDAAINISDGAQLSAWKYGIELGGVRKNWPFNSSSTLIGATLRSQGGTPNALVASNGVDLRGIVFGGQAFASTGFAVDGSGNVTGASYKAGASAGVSCSAGSVSLTTLTVTNGIVTHC